MDNPTLQLPHLPDLVRAKIASYYWSPQSSELMRDIRDYVPSLKAATKIYREQCGDEYENAEYDWLINDIGAYLNEDLATMYGYINNFYKLWSNYLKVNIWGWNSAIYMGISRRPPVWANPADGPHRYTISTATRSFIDSYLACLEKRPSKTEGRIYWAAMSPEMRKQFISIHE